MKVSSMYVPRRKNYYFLHKISFLVAILAASVLRTDASASNPTEVSSFNGSEAEAKQSESEQPFVCLGVCGDEGLELEDPDMVVEYQWNWRVPVCSGLSCETASCSEIGDKLPQMDIDVSECRRHQQELQSTAGCTCQEAPQKISAPSSTLDTTSNSSSSSNGSIGRGATMLLPVFVMGNILFEICCL